MSDIAAPERRERDQTMPDHPVFQTAGLTFESERIAREWQDENVPPILRVIVLTTAAYARERFGLPFRVTSIFRTSKENEAAKAKTIVHCLWRAVDVGTREWPEYAVIDVARFANERWIYDPERLAGPPVCYAGPHGTGPHLHFQAVPGKAGTQTRPAAKAA